MSLDFNFEDINEDVKRRDDRCWITDPEMTQRKRVAPVTEAIIYHTMSVGIGHITEKNWSEFAARDAIWAKLHGFDSLTPQEIKDHIGLRTNVINETRAQWAKRMFVGPIKAGYGDVSITTDFKLNAEREVAKPEATPA